MDELQNGHQKAQLRMRRIWSKTLSQDNGLTSTFDVGVGHSQLILFSRFDNRSERMMFADSDAGAIALLRVHIITGIWPPLAGVRRCRVGTQAGIHSNSEFFQLRQLRKQRQLHSQHGH